MRLVFSALIGLLWVLQAQALELDSPDLLATANLPRFNRSQSDAAEKTIESESVEKTAAPQIAQAPVAQTPAVKPAQPAAKQPVQIPATQPTAVEKPAAQDPGPQVNSKISLENFSWGADSRYRIQLYHDGKGLQFRGDLRADSRTEFTKDRLTIAIRHFPQDFLILTISVNNDMYAHVFLIEASGASKENPFRILNSRSIRANREGVMDEMEAMIAAFKKVSGFDVAQSMRKMAEYFAQNPNKKAKDLFDSVEREEAFVKVLAKPKVAGADDQGIVSPDMPPKVAQSPGPTKQPGQALDLRPNTAPPSADDDFQDPQQQAWLKQQRARLKAERERQQRQQRQQQGVTGYDVYGRPIYGNQNQQGDMVYDPNTGGYYRRQYQTPNYQQPQQQQQQPGYYRQNPFF